MAAGALTSAALVLTACGGGGGGGGDEGAGAKSKDQVEEAAAQESSDAHISIAPKTGADNVSINSGAKVTVTGGRLTSVTMTAKDDGTKVAGTIATGGKSWRPDDQLERGTEYTVTARAADADGDTATSNSTFTTVSRANSVIGYYTPEDGSTVGAGMPVSLNFDKAIKNKSAVESRIKVTSSSGQQVVGHWFGDKRIDFRPETYWKAGSKVSLDMNLDGVQASPGVYGVQDRHVGFTVGRAQVSTVDVKTKTMTVVRDGRTIKTIPISAGSPDNPTWNGRMVISEKHKETRMDGSTVGFTDDDGKGEYDIKDVPHAMRLSTSGTFIHGNYWAGRSTFGSANTSHGCVGLFDKKGADDKTTDAAWFYDNSMIGDVVVVKNSGDKTIAPDNGLNGWNMDWAQWVQGSAVQ